MKCLECKGKKVINYGTDKELDFDECYKCFGTGITQNKSKEKEE